MASSSVISVNFLQLFLISVIACKYSLAVKNINIYQKYYVIDSCTDDENITYELSGTGIHSVAKIGAFRSPSLHYGARNCTITIKPPSGYSVYLQIESFRFGYSYNESAGCQSYIQVSGNGTTSPKLCGLRPSLPPAFSSYGNMTIIFHFSDNYLLAGMGFTLIATAYKTSSCADSIYFICNNRRCIWQGLTCDDVNNCGDGSDEMLFGKSECYVSDPVRKLKDEGEEINMKDMLDRMKNVDVPPFSPDWKLVDIKPYSMSPIDWKITPDVVSYQSSHNISVGAALATAVFVILGAFIRFYCYYQCNQVRRQQVLRAVTIIRARSVLRPPTMNNATPPPPYETLVNDPEGHPENPPEYTTVNEMPSASASCSTPNTSVPSQHPNDKNGNVSCGPPPPYEP